MSLLNRNLNIVLVGIIYLVLSSIARSETYVTFYHVDGFGSPVAATSSNGELIWQDYYQPYGEPTNLPDEGSSNIIGHTGHVYDKDTQLVYLGARYYDPVLGRFMAFDPVGIDEDNSFSFNRYAYANNNPYSYNDPDGQIVDTAWDVFSLSLGVYSFVSNVSNGDYGAASLDAVGVVLDGAAAAIPFLPGGVGAAIKAVRGGDEISDFVTNKAVAGKITGYTKHGLNQAIGRNGGKGVNASHILDAVKNPKRVVEGANGTMKYQGKKATVILNSEGKVITTYGKSRGPQIWPQGTSRASGGGPAQRKANEAGLSYNPNAIR